MSAMQMPRYHDDARFQPEPVGQLSRAEYRRRSGANRKHAKTDYARAGDPAPYRLPQPRRTPMADLILRQADRRRSVLYAVGLRRRQAERDALPPVPSRVPPVPGWGRSEGARS